MNVKVTQSTYPVICPACRDNLNGPPAPPVSQCPACDIWHHSACLAEIGCASLNCHPVEDEASRNAQALEGDNPLAEMLREHRYLHGSNVETDADGLATITIGYTADHWEPDHIYTANRIALERGFGGEICHCDERGRTCDDHPGEETTSGCTFFSTSSVRGCQVEILAEPCGCRDDEDDPWRCEREMAETIIMLEEYPLIDEDLASEVEMAQEWSAWEDYARADFVSAIEARFPGWTDNADGWDHIDDLRHIAQEATGSYPEPCGHGEFNWPLNRWAEAIEEEDLIPHGFIRECESCDNEATHIWQMDQATCIPCAESAMEHGHKHVHDERDDCTAELEPLPGSTIPAHRITCENPMSEEN